MEPLNTKYGVDLIKNFFGYSAFISIYNDDDDDNKNFAITIGC